jgi:NADH:ubiquinone oxidoreductase subunit 3 (subunit A)
MDFLLSPPVAFLIYLPLFAGLTLLGKRLAGPDRKTGLYSSGEEAPTHAASPGYKTFILVACFFAIVHLGILVLATGPLSLNMALYLGGLLFALIALILR